MNFIILVKKDSIAKQNLQIKYPDKPFEKFALKSFLLLVLSLSNKN